ncbi:VanZ family protein [uncultured Gemmiger sp.]|uniref:VanZ family protein n=1 Tax=uncultured Gemmiger sp. TaxID=1623490 RepID=UPI0025EC53EF|nr:VanZ family protein [uncultured Gemmiger sp.]
MEREKTSPWLIVFRVIFTAALIACIAFIFRNSMESGTVSSARSQAVMVYINNLLARVHLGPLSEHTVRKLAHFSEFALEGFLLMLCIRVYTKHFVRHMSWPLLGGMTTALMDETIQLRSISRSSSVVDVWIDMAGVTAGLLAALVILLIVRGITAFARVERENRALRAEREELRRREHERLARRAAHRAHEAQLNRPEPDDDEYDEEDEE